eukprot:7534293-Pyramimonas_sp.AAC.1
MLPGVMSLAAILASCWTSPSPSATPLGRRERCARFRLLAAGRLVLKGPRVRHLHAVLLPLRSSSCLYTLCLVCARSFQPYLS